MKKKYPLASIVIPAYNCRSFVQRAIRSAARQDYPAKEIIVVDDGSTDDTETHIKDCGEKVCYIHQKHAGAGAARNKGIAAASGEFIAFLDADDEWNADRLTKGLQPFIDDDAVGMTYCYAHERHPDGTERVPNDDYERNRVFPRVLWPDAFQVTPATICRKSILVQLGGFDETLVAWEDQDLWIRMAEVAQVVVVKEILVTTHVRKGSLSQAIDVSTRQQCHHRVIERAFERRADVYRSKENIILADHYLLWGVEYYSRGNHGKALPLLYASLRRVPTMRCFLFILKALCPPVCLSLLRRIRGAN